MCGYPIHNKTVHTLVLNSPTTWQNQLISLSVCILPVDDNRLEGSGQYKFGGADLDLATYESKETSSSLLGNLDISLESVLIEDVSPDEMEKDGAKLSSKSCTEDTWTKLSP